MPFAVWIAGVALAQEPAPLDVVVERAPIPPGAASDPPWAGELGPGRGDVTVDGRLDEPAWAGASAPALGPFVDGGPGPDVRVRAAWSPDGVAVAVEGLAAGQTARLLVNPDGLAARWWIVSLTPTSAAWSVCDYGEMLLPIERAAAPDAATCRPAGDLPASGADGTWEVLLPRSAGARYTALARLDAVVIAPAGGGGRWGPGGREPQPTGGLPLAPGAPAVGVRTTLDLERRLVSAAPTLPAGGGPWRWRIVYRDVVLAEGPVEVDGAGAPLPVETDLPPLQRLAFVVEATDGDPPPAGLRWIAWEYAATLATPVFADRISVAVRTSAPVVDVPVEALGPDGVVLGAARVLLPTGASVVHVPVSPEWPDEVRVRVGSVADLVALRGPR